MGSYIMWQPVAVGKFEFEAAEFQISRPLSNPYLKLPALSLDCFLS